MAKVKQILRLLAPFIAVWVFWCLLHQGWLAILAYHAQILFWSRGSLSEIRRSGSRHIMFLALPTVVTGPLLYFILPYITHIDLSIWLTEHNLSPVSLAVMIPYFGIIHPFLEQLHWMSLREETALSHVMFAGYHLLILYSLLTLPWLIVSFVVLTVASVIWQQMAKRSRSLSLPIASHILADLGIIIAAWLRM